MARRLGRNVWRAIEKMAKTSNPSETNPLLTLADLDERRIDAACATVSNVANLASGAPSTVDGYSVVQGDTVLVMEQTTATQNGPYRVATVGTGANGVWVRLGEADQDTEFRDNFSYRVISGAVHGGTEWRLVSESPTLGTNAIRFQRVETPSLVGPKRWVFWEIAYTNAAFKAAAAAATFTLKTPGPKPYVVHDAFIDVVQVPVGVAAVKMKLGITDTLDSFLVLTASMTGGATGVVGTAHAGKGASIPVTTTAQCIPSPALQTANTLATFSADANFGNGTATTLSAGRWRVYMLISEPAQVGLFD